MSAGVDATRFVSCPEVSFSCLPTALHDGSIVVLDCSDSALLYSNLMLQRVLVMFVSFIGNNAILTRTQLVLMWSFLLQFVVGVCGFEQIRMLKQLYHAWNFVR